MKALRLSAYFAVFLVSSLFFVACSDVSVTETVTILPSVSPAPKKTVSSLARTPLPPPTRRSSVATDIPNATPIASLTPLPPPYTYVFPIQPPGAATYGEGTQGHGYPATDLFAKAGTKFVAVTAGVVEFVSGTDNWRPNHPDPAERSGLAVAIIGADGVRYYGSHLSGIAPGIYTGVRVKAGQLLGFVGTSGDARGKDPHLHFGISHPTTPGDWKTRRGEIDPFPYLNAWKKGINWTPQLP
jgi:peptidoglycan LD-endopeptidase LytH